MSDIKSTADMLVVTTSTIAGYRIAETKGAALGVVTFYDPLEYLRPQDRQTSNGEPIWEFGQIQQHFKDVNNYSLAGREHAMERLKENAVSLGANAVIDLRFDSCPVNTQYSMSGHVSYGIREIVAYGTAVVVETMSTK
jgi:uncharacterized protein YbjQ (UPF0145 family)